jgi:hypothetical protein
MRPNPPSTRDADVALSPWDGKRTRVDRRTVLRAGGVSIALPFLEAMRGKRALADAGVKRRFIAFFSPNGVPMRNWSPTGGETDFKLSPILQPLEAIRQKLIVLRGIDQKSGGAGDGHQNGMTGMLTGQVTNPGAFRGGCGQGGGWANGISVDQHIANNIGKSTKFKSLELGVVTSSTELAANFNRMSYAGPNMPLPPEENPVNTFNRLFGDLNVNPAVMDKLRGQRQTILNAVLDQYRYIKGKVGSEDGQKIESHFQAIREVETRLGTPTTGGVGPVAGGGGAGGLCAKPTGVEAVSNFKAYVEMPRIAKMQMDMLAMAFACDLSRVSTIEFSKSAGGTIMSWLGVMQSHHDISHAGDSDAAALDKLTKINNWYAQQFLYLAQRLDSYAEPGGGTILDNTVLFWCNELGKGNAHSTNDAPYVIAGSGGGYYKTGRFLQYSNTPHNNLLVSMYNAMGIPGNTFGRADWCTGPLAKIR